MTYAIFIVAGLVNLLRAFWDRKGGTKKQKLFRNIVVYGIAILSIVVAYIPLVDSILALLTWRICFYDYVVHAFLKRYSSIHKEKDINIWTYTGKSTYWWDQWIAKINPWLRLIVRVILFAASLVWFLS